MSSCLVSPFDYFFFLLFVDLAVEVSYSQVVMEHLGRARDQRPAGSVQDSPHITQRLSEYIVPCDTNMSAAELETFNWEQLHKNYVHAMEEHGAIETDLRARISKLLEVVQSSSLLLGCSLMIPSRFLWSGPRPPSFVTKQEHSKGQDSYIKHSTGD